MPPSIVPNIIYIAPTYIALEIINVGDSAANEVSINYQLKGIFQKQRKFSPPLLKAGESKTIFLQDDNNTLISDLNIYKKKQTSIQVNVSYKDATKLSSKIIHQKNNIDVTNYIKENEQNSIRFEDTTMKKIESHLRKLSQDFTFLRSDFRRIDGTLNGQLLLERTKFQTEIIKKRLHSKLKKTKFEETENLIDELSRYMIEPHLDLSKKEVTTILDKLESIDRIAYDEVWTYYSSLKYSRISFRSEGI